MSAQVQTVRIAPARSYWLPWLLVLGGLVGALYASVLVRLVQQWWEDPNFGHGFLVPLFVAYLLWQRRDQWRNVPLAPTNFGILVILAAMSLLIAGTLGAELFVSRFSLLVLLAGMVLFLAGRKMLWALAFPLGYLALMIPLPGIVYNRITFPLQLLASRLAAASLEAMQVPVLREGNLLFLPNYTLAVVEACSGVRSLMSLIALSVAYGFLVKTRTWVRVVLVALTLPIAVVSNSFRVVVTGLLTYFWGPQPAEGFLHLFSGWLVFLAAVILTLLAHRLLALCGPVTGRSET
jgi:exosortase